MCQDRVKNALKSRRGAHTAVFKEEGINGFNHLPPKIMLEILKVNMTAYIQQFIFLLALPAGYMYFYFNVCSAALVCLYCSYCMH